MNTASKFFRLGAWTAALAIAAGAFGAHGLKDRLEPRMLEIFEIAVRYQMYSALGLIATAWAYEQNRIWANRAGFCLLAGCSIFSGSLYALALTGIKAFGAITPFGGVLMIAGWIFLGFCRRL